jgi:acetyl-CoA acetyltransferase
MTARSFDNVVVAGAYNTEQAKHLKGHNSISIAVEAAKGVLKEAAVDLSRVDGIMGRFAGDVGYHLGLGPIWDSRSEGGIWAIMLAAHLVQSGTCEMLLIADGGAGVYTDRASTAPWTRPANEFTAPFGMYTAVEFALIARRHMEVYGTTPEQLAAAAAIIRNNGHVNPEAIYAGRGPFTPEDVLASRMVADPFHLLDCSMTSEGGCALLLTTPERAKDLPVQPVSIVSGGLDHRGPPYKYPPVFDLRSRTSDEPLGFVGRPAARTAFATAGLSIDDVDCAELYDPFSFEIIRQLEAFGFCPVGEGGAFVEDGHIGPDGRFPVTTDGGTMSYSHAGGNVQMMQRVIRGVHQIQGRCASNQLKHPRVVLCSNGGAGAFFTDVLLLRAMA